MKRLLSFILALCMLAALFPVMPGMISAADTIAYIYNFRNEVITGDVGAGIPMIDSYDKTTSPGKWMYYGMEDDLAALYAERTTKFDSQSYGIRIQPSTTGMYAQIKLSVPELSVYIPTLTYYNNGSATKNMDVYLAPFSAEDYLAEDYKLGTVNHRQVDKNTEGTISFNEFTTTETEYVLTFKVGGSHVGNMVATQLELKEPEVQAQSIEYVFDTSVTGGTVSQITELTDYNTQGGRNWKHYATDISGNKRTLSECINLVPSAVGQFQSFTLLTIPSGTYEISFDYATREDGGAGSVYFAPASDAENSMDDKYLIGNVDYYSTNPKSAAPKCDGTVAFGKKTILADEEYIITFKNTGKREAAVGYSMNPSKLTLTPAEPEPLPEPEPEPQELYTFDFGYVSGNAQFNVGVPTLDSYDKTGRNWKYCGMEATLLEKYTAEAPAKITRARTLAGCINVTPSDASGQWMALTLKGVYKGEYRVFFDYATHKSGGIGDVFLAPASIPESSRYDEKYRLGTVNYYEKNAAFALGNRAFFGSINLESSGDYVITFKHTGEKTPEATGYLMNPSMLTLDARPLVLETISMNMEKLSLPEGEVWKAVISGKYNDATEADLNDGEISFESSDENVAVVGEDGKISAVAPGVTTIKATVVLGEAKKEASVIIRVEEDLAIFLGTAKRGPTYYTYEKRENAVENVKKYSWAKEQKEAAVQIADTLLGKEDLLWELITQEGIPRAQAVGYMEDPEMYCCRYCGVQLRQKYGMFPYIVDAVERPWKIQCPDCKRLFPSNDFESFYKLGIDENGNFSHKLAHEKNAELVAEDESGYLVNILYPEIGGENHPESVKFTEGETTAGWGVDDGFGYLPGRTYDNGVEECHAYIAFYNHCAIWMGPTMTQYPSSLVGGKLAALRDAYLYTGDEKYGRLGAIIIDRVADVYPEYSLTQYGKVRGEKRQFWNSHGQSDEGKAIGRIWETDLARSMALSYDAFWPMMEDEAVISFLSGKAEKYSFENPKTDARFIRGNCEDGILRAIFEGCKKADIYGNYGMHQAALAAAAVVLDSQPETEEWIDWIMQDGVKTVGRNTGGNVNSQMYTLVDRDGHGNESSLEYNGLWVSRSLEFAEYLYGYDGYTEANIYANPRFLKMMKAQGDVIMTSNTAPQIGDGSAAASLSVNFTAENMLKEYIRTGDTELGQLAYFANGNSTDGMHADIFTKNPEKVQEDIRNIINTYGEYDFGKTVNLTGYGLAVLRDGRLYGDVISTSGANADTQRDFWIYYGGGGGSHRHYDALNLGIEAFGLNVAPDLGYPEDTGQNRNRHMWVNNTISHNTVVVDAQKQNKLTAAATPLHFDDGGMVKLMDVDASEAYDQTDIYRRTVVMIKLSENESYGVDFFRVKGGDDHIYSFHSQSEEVTLPGETLIAQEKGTYAGENVEWGDESTAYDNGFSWLENVRRVENPSGGFTADFKVRDYHNTLKTNPDLGLKFTMLNDFELTEVAVAEGMAPRVKKNIKAGISHFEYLLVRRKAKNLDSLFTSVIEPYKDASKITSIEAVPVVGDSTETSDDVARAVLVRNKNGRMDYIVYATDNTVTYTVDNSFTFRGFIGVHMCDENGNIVYSYVHDGDIIADISGKASISGVVTDFTKGYVSKNTISATLEAPVNAEELAGKYVYVNNDGVQNGVYRIESAICDEAGNAVFDIGDVSLARSVVGGETTYNIASGDTFRIPLTTMVDNTPTFSETGDKSVSAENRISFSVAAEGSGKSEITYAADLPRGASLDEKTGAFVWRPDSSQVGKHVVRFYARDGAGEKAMDVVITVYGSTTGSKNETSEVPSTDTPSNGGGGGGGGDTAPTPDTDKTDDDESLLPDEKVPDADEADEAENGDNDNIRFTDLGSHAWAEDSINELAADGIIKGTTASTFSPAANITRADFALLLVRAFDLTSDNTENFEDVSASDYFAAELAVARNTGIVNGIGDNKYAPRNTISRQDMMVIVYRALQSLSLPLEEKGDRRTAVDKVLSQYPDFDTVAEYAKEAVINLISEGLVDGKSGRIAPLEYTTRAEIAVLLKRILDYTKK